MKQWISFKMQTIFTHVRISTENIIGKKSLKKFWLKKLPNKGTIVKARLVLENNSLDTLFALYFHLRNQEVNMKYNQSYTNINKNSNMIYICTIYLCIYFGNPFAFLLPSNLVFVISFKNVWKCNPMM